MNFSEFNENNVENLYKTLDFKPLSENKRFEYGLDATDSGGVAELKMNGCDLEFLWVAAEGLVVRCFENNKEKWSAWDDTDFYLRETDDFDDNGMAIAFM